MRMALPCRRTAARATGVVAATVLAVGGLAAAFAVPAGAGVDRLPPAPLAHDTAETTALEVLLPFPGTVFHDPPSFSGTGQNGATVSVTVDGTTVGETVAESAEGSDNGLWYIDVDPRVLPPEGEVFDATVTQAVSGDTQEVVIEDLSVDVWGSVIDVPMHGDEVDGAVVFEGRQHVDGVIALLVKGTTADGQEVKAIALSEGSVGDADLPRALVATVAGDERRAGDLAAEAEEIDEWSGKFALSTGATGTVEWTFTPAEALAEGQYSVATGAILDDDEVDIGNQVDLTVTAGADVADVALELTAPATIEGAAGDVVEIETGVRNDGPDDLVGGTVDFEVPAGASVVGIKELELQGGTERPVEGCALVNPRHVACHTEATLPAGESNAAIFQVQLGASATGELGAAVLEVAGDNGGSATAETALTVAGTDGDEVELELSAPESVEGAAGEVVEIETRVRNAGPGDLVGGSVDFEVPAGASVVGIKELELQEGSERPVEGCAQVNPRRVECHTEATLPAGESNAATFEVRYDEGVDAGELGTAVLVVEGDNAGSATAETTLTVTGEPDPSPSPTEDGEDGDGGGDLPDTGAVDLAWLGLAAGLLGAGAAAVASRRARRSTV